MCSEGIVENNDEEVFTVVVRDKCVAGWTEEEMGGGEKSLERVKALD